MCCPWDRRAQPYPCRGVLTLPLALRALQMRGSAWVTDGAKASGCQGTWVPTGPGLGPRVFLVS